MPAQREEDEARIRQQVDKIMAGIRAKDLEGLRRLYATDVVSFDVEPPLQHVGIEAKLENWARAFTFFQDVDYEVRDLTVTAGDDVAFGHAFGRLSGTLKDGTVTSGMWVRGTFCFRKLGRTWLIVHDQASVPFDIASGKGVTDLEPRRGAEVPVRGPRSHGSLPRELAHDGSSKPPARLCVQTVLVFVTGQAWIYLLQFPVARLSLALLFACSAPTEHPLVSRLAAEVVSLRHGGTDNPVLHRFFQRATWLWAVIFGVLAIVFPALIATQPIAFFLLISTGIIVVAVGSGAGASALWFFTVLRRSGQRLSFAGR